MFILAARQEMCNDNTISYHYFTYAAASAAVCFHYYLFIYFFILWNNSKLNSLPFQFCSLYFVPNKTHFASCEIFNQCWFRKCHLRFHYTRIVYWVLSQKKKQFVHMYVSSGSYDIEYVTHDEKKALHLHPYTRLSIYVVHNIRDNMNIKNF